MSAPASGRSVALVGLRCTGKTSIGRRLAELRGWPFVDLDLELGRLHRREHGEVEAAPAAGQLLGSLGIAAFRLLEERALEELLGGVRCCVLATGGGAVESQSNRQLLRRACTSIWLRAEPALLRRRMERDPSARPALTDAGALDEIEALSIRRAPLYARVASIELDVNTGSVDELARRLLALLDSPRDDAQRA